jgi:hypothetical protein
LNGGNFGSITVTLLRYVNEPIRGVMDDNSFLGFAANPKTEASDG